MVPAQVPGIAPSKQVTDVLVDQNRRTLLPDAVIAIILGQLDIKSIANHCCAKELSSMRRMKMNEAKGVIISSTVMGNCSTMQANTCDISAQTTVTPVSSSLTPTSGALMV
ncbi:hypothetical protein KIN20_003756 [Parelaphostrongylus tenuis]|uniref:Uncharacterized protein n=1 Tax=Parelaphostrongylus tenuis TaxID=148309 RepID=A0AAD5LZM9_PARTN|nr:hypothetical protein KIN20_003756 [Parelaphostrongylus tenuis]